MRFIAFCIKTLFIIPLNDGLLTCAKYSSEMRPAHSIHSSSGLQGLEMSAHFINMRLTRIRFSGDVKMLLTESASPFAYTEKDSLYRFGAN